MTIDKNGYSVKMSCCLAVVLALFQAGAVHAQTGVSEKSIGDKSKVYSRDRIFEVIRSRKMATEHKLTLVAAHRGYWEKYPENSWGAIMTAANLGFEIIEADIKPAANNEPVVFHDIRLERVTNGTGLLGQTKKSDFLALRLRDRFGVSYPHTEEIKPLDFEALLDNYSDYLVQVNRSHNSIGNPHNRPGYVLALDVKGNNANDPADAWPLVEKVFEKIKEKNASIERDHGLKNLLTNAFLIKIAAESLPDYPDRVARMIAGAPDNLFNLCVVVDGKDKSNLFERRPKVDANVELYKGKPYVSTFEVVMKYSGDQDSHRFLVDNSIKASIGNYLPYGDFPRGSAKSEAVCCVTPNTDTDKSDQYIDYRGRWAWAASTARIDSAVEGGIMYVSHNPKFNILTIDRPDLLVDFLKTQGWRNTQYIQYSR